jgi:hypothetical protein
MTVLLLGLQWRSIREHRGLRNRGGLSPDCHEWGRAIRKGILELPDRLQSLELLPSEAGRRSFCRSQIEISELTTNEAASLFQGDDTLRF